MSSESEREQIIVNSFDVNLWIQSHISLEMTARTRNESSGMKRQTHLLLVVFSRLQSLLYCC